MFKFFTYSTAVVAALAVTTSTPLTQAQHLEPTLLESAYMEPTNFEPSNNESANNESAHLDFANLKPYPKPRQLAALSAIPESASLESVNMEAALLKAAKLEAAFKTTPNSEEPVK